MKVLIVSDTHRRNENYLKIVEKEQPLDLVIHCGDVEGSEYLIGEAAGCNAHIVSGNNDFFSELPRELEITIGECRALVTHGHVYHVSMGNERIKQEAKARGCDLVFYGHTHKPVIDEDGEIIAVNPGSVSYPRQEGRQPSYVIMLLEQGEKPRFQVCFI